MTDPRRILVTNDDGIESPGPWMLAEPLSVILSEAKHALSPVEGNLAPRAETLPVAARRNQ